MDILVTGSAGFIGSHLSEHLVALGHSVLGVDCITDYYSKVLKELNANHIQEKGVSFLPLDLAKDDLSSATRNIEIVFHLAAQPGISARTSFELYLRNNVIATYRLLEALRRSNRFGGLINVSTSSVYGADATGNELTEPRPTSYYGVTKLSAEQLILSLARDQGFPACSLRLFSVYGPRERPEKLYPKLIGCILENKEFPLHEGSQHHVRSYTYIRDAINGLLAAMNNFDECIGEIFNIGTDAAITTAEGIRIVEAILGKSARIKMKSKRPGDQVRTHANIEKARNILGYNPTTLPTEGLKEEVEWYRQHILGKIDLWPARP